MAITTLQFDLTWENGNAIQLTRKEGAEAAILIAKMEENGDIASAVSYLSEIMRLAFTQAVKRACDEMSV